MKQGALISNRDNGPLSSRALLELRLYSTFIFVFAALLMQFLLTFYTACLLSTFSYPIRYSLFTINYLSESSANWSVYKIFLVFGSGPVLFTCGGFILLYSLKKISNAIWKTKLAITWMAFLMVNALPCGIVAGIFIFDSFGIAFQWSVSKVTTRVVIGLVVYLILTIFIRFWQRLFLKAAYTAEFLDSGDHQKIFLKNVYFKPWIYGLIILMLFNWPFNSYFWPVFLLSLGYLTILSMNQSFMFLNLRIMRSEKRIFTHRFQILYILIVLGLIWIAGNFRINF